MVTFNAEDLWDAYGTGQTDYYYDPGTSIVIEDEVEIIRKYYAEPATFTLSYNQTVEVKLVSWRGIGYRYIYFHGITYYTVSLAAESGGTVSGAGTYAYGTAVTVTASPSAGYMFSHWSDGNTSASRTVTVTADVSLTAYFTPIYTVTFVTGGYGSVHPAQLTGVPQGTSVTVSGNTLTIGGTTVTAVPASATPQYTYAFSSWSGVPGTIVSDVTVTATFTRTVNDYTIALIAGEGGSVSGAGTYAYGTEVTISATPDTGRIFYSWSDGNTSAVRTVTVTEDLQLQAYFDLSKVYARVNGEWKPADTYAKIDGAWVQITDIYVKENGTWIRL